MGVHGGKIRPWKRENTPTCDAPPREPQTQNWNQNWKFFFWLGTNRLAESAEGLNTSQAAAGGKL